MDDEDRLTPGQTPEEVADFLHVPLAAVIEAIDWCKNHWDIVIDDHAHEAILVTALVEVGVTQLGGDHLEELRRRRQVEDAVAAGAVGRVNFLQPLAQELVAGRIVKLAGRVVQTGTELLPRLV